MSDMRKIRVKLTPYQAKVLDNLKLRTFRTNGEIVGAALTLLSLSVHHQIVIADRDGNVKLVNIP